jgi:cysteine desulfurase
MTPIFMDYHSTTPVDPRALNAMLPYFTQKFGNAASRNHAFGLEAEEAVAQARAQIAQLIHATPEEIIFTSGATESNNIALAGIAESYRKKGNHIITVVTEHKSIMDTVAHLEKTGFKVTRLPVDSYGRINSDTLLSAITDQTILISVMVANNEIGTIQPIAEIGKIARSRGILFHSDAAQAVGKISVDVNAMCVDLLSFSAHKLYGPKGIGALYVRRSPEIRLTPLFHGGGHERGIRSGTLNVPGIVGFGTACAICADEMPLEAQRLKQMRDRLKTQIFNRLDDVYLNGHPEERLPHNLNISFSGIEAESLLIKVRSVALSLGSACMTGALAPSYVLTALGIKPDLAYGSVRFGLGRFNTDEEVNTVSDCVILSVEKLRAISPLYKRTKGSAILSR